MSIGMPHLKIMKLLLEEANPRDARYKLEDFQELRNHIADVLVMMEDDSEKVPPTPAAAEKPEKVNVAAEAQKLANGAKAEGKMSGEEAEDDEQLQG